MEHEPDILKPGMDFVVKGWSKNISPVPVTNGITTSRTYKFGIEVRVQRHSICDTVQGGCPVKPGELLSISRNNIPSHAPGGEYLVKTKTLDRDGRVVACVDWYFDVTK
jgi:hypothetical protein